MTSGGVQGGELFWEELAALGYEFQETKRRDKSQPGGRGRYFREHAIKNSREHGLPWLAILKLLIECF